MAVGACLPWPWDTHASPTRLDSPTYETPVSLRSPLASLVQKRTVLSSIPLDIGIRIPKSKKEAVAIPPLSSGRGCLSKHPLRGGGHI